MGDPGLSDSELLAGLRLMVRIRRFEDRVRREFARGDMPGFVHTYVGAEAVAAGVGALVVPVERDAVAVAGERLHPLPRVVAAGKGRRNRPLRHRAVGIALALVEAGRADQAERRPRR